MKNAKLQKLLDYIPLVLLCFFAIMMFFWENVWVWSNYVAIVLIATAVYCFYRNHQLGVIAIMFILIFGLFGVVRLSPGTTTFFIGLGKSNQSKLAMPGFQPQYLLGIILHAIISRRYYFGIVTKKYWIDFRRQLVSTK